LLWRGLGKAARRQTKKDRGGPQLLHCSSGTALEPTCLAGGTRMEWQHPHCGKPATRQDERTGNCVGCPRYSGLATGLELLLHQLFDPV
jgi:hypothetical protein